jgi:hypothetical protein
MRRDHMSESEMRTMFGMIIATWRKERRKRGVLPGKNSKRWKWN